MARIDLSNIKSCLRRDGPLTRATLRFASEVNQAFEHGGAYALLGPSGCGKTTLLNIISGLVHPTHGRVRINGDDVTDLPDREAQHRAGVSSSLSIYDTMTVRENLEFPAAQSRRFIRRYQAGVSIEVIEIDWAGPAGHAASAGTDSADEKQKVSLGRGLVREDVSAMLFDEPLTVDRSRSEMDSCGRSCAELQRQSGMTMIYVTHDQTEALTFADQVSWSCMMGEMVQVGTPKPSLFEKPAQHTFVGYFIGSPGMNVLPTKVDGANMMLGEHAVPLPWAPRLEGDCEARVRGPPRIREAGRRGYSSSASSVLKMSAAIASFERACRGMR